MNPRRFRRIKRVLDRRQPDLTVLMERVNKPHNFSAILRNCDAVGVLEVHAVIPERGIDIHHHTSGGTKRWMKIVRHPDVDVAVSVLHRSGYRVLAAHLTEDAEDYREVDLSRPVAFMMGAELYGVSDPALELADGAVRIPMVGMVKSLNVSVAAALLLYEAFRQRMSAGMYDRSRLPEDAYARTLFEWAYPREARLCRDAGVPYPPLGPDGEMLKEPPGKGEQGGAP
jgi:tRNA (guanosine-2'-O-)-methyltransferase